MTLADAGRESAPRRPRNPGIAFEVFSRGAAIAAERGVIIADTKLDLAGLLMVPSSWPMSCSRPTRRASGPPGLATRAAKRYLDKQFVRDWSSSVTAGSQAARPGGPL